MSIQISFVLSLFIFLLSFYLFPRFETTSREETVYIAPALNVIEIPPTRQPEKPGPPPGRPLIPIALDEIEIIDDVPIRADKGDELTDSLRVQQFIEGIPLVHRPKQIIEVVPKSPGTDVKGKIILLLRIGKDGRMSDYRLVLNTTGSQKALEYAIEAAGKSMWENAQMKGKTVEYWIEKSYKFNL